MASRSYDIWLQFGNGERMAYMFGPRGGLSLGHALKEPSAPSRVDTILIQSLHHGAGRFLATDPEMIRDSNGEQVFADTRQLGYIMPGGALQLLGSIPITDASVVEALQAYAAVFTDDVGNVIFGAGRQIIEVEIADDNLVNFNANIAANSYFTGSVVEWNRDAWLGVQDASYITTGAYNYDDDVEDTSSTYMHSWSVSTRNAIFWIRNRDGAAPEMRWSDRTDQDYGNFNANFIYPDATNGFILEIPKASVTGMGVAGQYALFASKGGNIWGFDADQVFIPLTPAIPGGFIDNRFGGFMSYVGSWMLVPNIDGLGRFDPRNISLVDISPAVHQGATPEIGTMDSKAIQATSPSPTGAVVAGNLIGSEVNILQIEMYEDGMFYHPALLYISGISRVWGMMVTRAKDGADFTSQLRCYIIASDTDYENWNVYRLDLATASWSPGPENIAASSGFRTGFYTTRPPDISSSPTQIRGYARASVGNPITLWLEVDNDQEQYQLGIITRDGPFTLPVPTVTPGRKYAIAGSLDVSDSANPCYLMLPLSLDYRYVESFSPDAPDFVTLKFMASTDQINRVTSRVFSHGRSEAEMLIRMTGTVVTIGFTDTRTPWEGIVEQVDTELMYQDDGRTATSFLVTMVIRRTK